MTCASYEMFHQTCPFAVHVAQDLLCCEMFSVLLTCRSRMVRGQGVAEGPALQPSIASSALVSGSSSSGPQSAPTMAAAARDCRPGSAGRGAACRPATAAAAASGAAAAVVLDAAASDGAAAAPGVAAVAATAVPADCAARADARLRSSRSSGAAAGAWRWHQLHGMHTCAGPSAKQRLSHDVAELHVPKLATIP